MGHRPRTAVPDTRPRPLATAAEQSTNRGLFASVILALAGYGVLTVTTADALIGLLGLLPGLINAVTALLTATGIVRRAEPEVTPVESPRARDGSPLTRAQTRKSTGNPVRPLESRHRPARDVSGPGRDEWWGTPTPLFDQDAPRASRDPAADALAEAGPESTQYMDVTGTGLRAHDNSPAARALDDAAAAELAAGGRGGYSPPDSYPTTDTAGSAGGGHHHGGGYGGGYDSGSSGGGHDSSSSSGGDSGGGM